MHTPSTSGIHVSAQRLSNGLQVNYSRKRAAASQGHGYCVLTTTQLTPTWYCCIARLCSPWQHIAFTTAIHTCVHFLCHHGNMHCAPLCVTMATYTCTFCVHHSIYMYVALSLSPWQQCNKIQAGHWCTLGPVLCTQVNITMVTHASLFTEQILSVYATIMCTKCRYHHGYAHVNILVLIILYLR